MVSKRGIKDHSQSFKVGIGKHHSQVLKWRILLRGVGLGSKVRNLILENRSLASWVT